MEGEDEKKAADDPCCSFSLTTVFFGFPLCFSDRCKYSWRDGTEGGVCVCCSV